MQFITISGNVGRDSEIKQAGTGTVCNFSVACNEKGRNGEPDVTTWYRCAIWGKRGEAIARYINKGTRVTVAGRLRLGVYTGKDGAAKVDATIDVDEIDFTNTERVDQGAHASAPQVADDPIPF